MNKDKKPIYPIDLWDVTETAFLPENNYRNETTFSLSNGYIGTRGTFEEAYPFDEDHGLEGNFVNGFYESVPIRYGEANFGSPARSQTLLNLPNLKQTRLFLDGEAFSMDEGVLEDYSRTLHMHDGFLERKLIWTSPGGKKAAIHIRRLASFEEKHILAICCEVKPLNFSGTVRFVSVLQADVENHTRKTNPIVDYGPFGRRLDPVKLTAADDVLYYEGVTKGSGLTVACGSIHRIVSHQPAINRTYHAGELDGSFSLTVKAVQGESVVLEKMICYATSLDTDPTELEPFTKKTLAAAARAGYDRLEEAQKGYFHAFWQTADVEIESGEGLAIRQGLHFNLFHIFQSAGRDNQTGMGAKGLSGEGYEGHYFWDTEMYVLPVLIFTAPEAARALLRWRWSKLPQARDRARILGHDKGALFPWRTINGKEASTYYPLGTAQYHINADVAYALSLYLQATGDTEFLAECGVEMFIETARVWADVGSFSERRGGKYCICSVTGPDEYNVLVDNNFYTNLMARENLRDAAGAVRWLRETSPAAMDALGSKLGFQVDELALWDAIADNMYLPYDEKEQIYPMDDGFMIRKPWDESRIPPEKRAWLYENYHPLFIMRHRMSKQADAILGMYLHSNYFTQEELRRNYDFYQTVTLHHSSLSTCIFGIVAAGIGYMDQAYGYFSDSARMDLDDYHNNFYAGIHAANMAGTWQAVINGFAGMRLQKSKLSFAPRLPEQWESYRFQVLFRGARLQVTVGRAGAEFALLEGGPVRFSVFGHEVTLETAGGKYFEKV